MIQGRLFGGKLNLAILTLKAIPSQHVGPRKRGRAASYPKKTEQSNHRWGFYRHGYRSNVVVILLNDLHFSQKEEPYGVLPGDDSERFVARAQKED
jgi:hypothetical protein